MGNSRAMAMLRKNSDAINVLIMFITKYSMQNEGKNLCVTHSETKGFMAPATFAKAKLWCMALGFLHCTRYGRLERNASVYDLTTKWRHLSDCPEKLARIIKLLQRYGRVTRIPIKAIRPRGELTPQNRKHMLRRRIEQEIIRQ